jgi:AcrR family transcriptional regulator
MIPVARTDAGGYRERLLAGAVSCLQEKGYAHTTARDLVAASGTNLASIGYHFGGKDALLNEAIAAIFDQWTERVERALFGAELGSPREMLQRAMAELVDVFDELRPVLILCVEGYPAALRAPVLRERLAEAYARTRVAGADMLRRASGELGVELPMAPEADVAVAARPRGHPRRPPGRRRHRHPGRPHRLINWQRSANAGMSPAAVGTSPGNEEIKTCA